MSVTEKSHALADLVRLLADIAVADYIDEVQRTEKPRAESKQIPVSELDSKTEPQR